MAGDEKGKEKEGSGDSGEDQQIDFHGAAILDENGEEIPITEDMIQEACEKLDKNWVLKPGTGDDQAADSETDDD